MSKEQSKELVELMRAMLAGNFKQSDEIINKLQEIVISKLDNPLI